MHARWSGCAEERGRVFWAEAGSSSAVGRLSLGGGGRERARERAQEREWEREEGERCRALGGMGGAGPSTATGAGRGREAGLSLRERQRRSICEPIREESSPSRDGSPCRDVRSVPSSPLQLSPVLDHASIYPHQPHPVSDIALDVYKRHHRPRAPPIRSLSTPNLPLLISTNTTKPVHINQP